MLKKLASYSCRLDHNSGSRMSWMLGPPHDESVTVTRGPFEEVHDRPPEYNQHW